MSRKVMQIRRDDTCASCSVPLPAGATAVWFAKEKATRCMACAAAYDEPRPAAVAPVLAAEPSPALPVLPTLPRLPPPAAAPPAPAALVAESVAGGSAQSEYSKRSAKELARKQQKMEEDAQWRKAIVAERPILGRVASVLTPKPTIGPESQSTKAWKVGAEGERRVAEVLAAAEGVAAMHDRLVPGKGKANIDHLAIGPSGVFVIDAKKYTGDVETRNVGNIFRQDWRLFVAGRNQTKLVDGVQGQVETVKVALSQAFPEVPVRGVLCFIGATWNRPMRPLIVDGVTALWPVKLTDHVSVPGQWGHLVPQITEHLRQHLKPAS